MPVYFVQIAFQLTEFFFQIEIDAVIYTDQFTCYIGTWPASVAQLDAPSDWRPGGRRVQPPPRSATFFRGD